MTISLLTWSAPYKGAAVASTSANDGFTALYNSFVAAVANADYPWSIASYDNASSSTRYICLKRKSGASGRVLFLYAVTSTDGQWNTNIQLSTASPATLMGCCYISGATSDTPSNIRNSSGAMFTGENIVTSSPISGAITPAIGASEFWETSANEDVIAVFNLTSAEAWADNRKAFYVGVLMANPSLDTTKAASVCSGGSNMAPLASPVSLSYGAFTRSNIGAIEHWGIATETLTALMLSKSRNLSLKKTYFPSIRLGSFQPALAEDSFGWQIRQVSYQVTPLAGREALSDGTSVFARSVGAETSSSTYWLTNFKLHT